MNQNFNQGGANLNQNSQMKSNQGAGEKTKEEIDSPEPMNFKKRNPKNSFLSEISNALAANPQSALNNERDKPSFTI